MSLLLLFAGGEAVIVPIDFQKDHAIAVKFRDKRITAIHRDKRLPAKLRDKRILSDEL